MKLCDLPKPSLAAVLTWSISAQESALAVPVISGGCGGSGGTGGAGGTGSTTGITGVGGNGGNGA